MLDAGLAQRRSGVVRGLSTREVPAEPRGPRSARVLDPGRSVAFEVSFLLGEEGLVAIDDVLESPIPSFEFGLEIGDLDTRGDVPIGADEAGTRRPEAHPIDGGLAPYDDSPGGAGAAIDSVCIVVCSDHAMDQHVPSRDP